MPPVRLSCREYGDAGLLVEVLEEDPGRRWTHTQALGAQLRRQQPEGLVDVVAAFDSVFVTFDPLRTDRATIEATVVELAGHKVDPRPPRRFELPVVYGGSHGPDLEDTADRLGLTPDALVRLHTSQDWVVRVVASPVGAPLMDGPRLPDSVPRLEVPRPRVPPGSLGLSGAQSIVYNAASPGGWRLIGRTPLTLFDLDRPPHVPYAPGDRIRFVPVPAEDWDRLIGHPLRPAEAAS